MLLSWRLKDMGLWELIFPIVYVKYFWNISRKAKAEEYIAKKKRMLLCPSQFLEGTLWALWNFKVTQTLLQPQLWPPSWKFFLGCELPVHTI